MSNPAMNGRHSTVNLADVRADLTTRTLNEVAAAHDVSPATLRSRLRQHGFSSDGTPMADTQRPRIGSGSQGQVGAYIGGRDRPISVRPWGAFVRGGEA